MSEGQRDDWNPRDPAILEDQRRAFDDLRERCPVAHSDFLGWSLFRHADVVAALADPATFSNASRFLAIPNGMDPPVHGRYRDALAVHFNPQQMTRLEPRAREIATQLLVPAIAAGEAEFIDAFAAPFALRTQCAMLGWREELWECLAGWTHGSQQAAFSRDHAAGKALASLFSEHVKANLDERRRSPAAGSEDATAGLLRTEVEGTLLDDDQIVSILRNWTAGQGTVVAALGILLLHLSDDRALQDRLRSEPSLIAAAIEEILRADGPLVANRRVATRDVEVQGRIIPQGDSLTVMWIAADRDPRAFDDPDAVIVERNTDSGLVWGQGIHVCLGAPLARMEMRVAIEELLSRTKHVALAGDVPPRNVYPSNGLSALRLRVST